MKKAIILANGDAPKIGQINYLNQSGYSTITCADGGANTARKMKIRPDYIIGDLDSITNQNLAYFRDKCEIIEYSRQNDTDVEKALKFLIKKKFQKVILLGGTGDRLDHSICNLGIVLKFHDKINISILHKRSFLRPYSCDTKLMTVKGEVISIYGFHERTKITSNGLKYPLRNESLSFGIKESTSNVANSNEVDLKISDGIIFVIRDFNLLKKNDLI